MSLIFRTSDQDLHHGAAAFELTDSGLDLIQSVCLGNESIQWYRACRSYFNGFLEILVFINPGAAELQLAPEKPEEVHFGRLGENADNDDTTPGSKKLRHQLSTHG